jgi:hypothetical protein
MGFPNVVAVTCGAGTLKEEWIDDLEQFNEVYLSCDMDADGRTGVEKAANKLGRYRCLNVLLPLKDANDCLKAGEKAAVEKADEIRSLVRKRKMKKALPSGVASILPDPARMDSIVSFLVQYPDSAKRLDVFLSQKDPALSRSQIKRLIETG